MSVHTPPKARPAAAVASIAIALAPIALAVISVRDLAVTQGWTTGTAWSLSLVQALDGLTATTGVLAVAIAIGVVGLLLVWLAIKPAHTTHLRSKTDSDLWLSAAAVAALAQGIADRAPGVISADTSRANGRKITVDVVTNQDRQAVTDRVDTAIQSKLQGLTKAKITVRTKQVAR